MQFDGAIPFLLSSADSNTKQKFQQMPSFIPRRRPRTNELGLEFANGADGVEAALFAPRAHGIPLMLTGMQPDCAITTARDLAAELELDVAVIDKAGIWHDDLLEAVGGPLTPNAIDATAAVKPRSGKRRRPGALPPAPPCRLGKAQS